MRNFEADKLVRVGDVMNFLETYTGVDGGGHEIDLGEFGYETITCDAVVDLDAVATELLRKVVEDA